MNNEWLNSLRSRMEDHEEDIPDGLWDDIRDELFTGEEEKNIISGQASEPNETIEEKHDINGQDIGQRSLLYRIAGIAAAIVLLILTMRTIPKQKIDGEVIAQNQKETEQRAGSAAGKILANPPMEEKGSIENAVLGQNTLNLNTSGEIFKPGSLKNIWKNEANNIDHTKETQETGNIAGAFPQENPVSAKTASANETLGGPVKEELKDQVLLKEHKEELYTHNKMDKPLKSYQKRSWMLSMLTGNASSNSAEQQFPGYASISGKPINVEEVWSATEHEEDPLTEIFLANQSKQVEARIRHKIPVTFGLSLYYNLGKKWGIGTGLNYTKLASELHSGSGNNYIKGGQIVHYVGIPVQVNYNVVQKGQLTGYITGGALVEKPVAGNITTTYIVNGEAKETIKEKLNDKPLQFSVNTAVGIQLKVIDRFGIYAEPGIGYHFKGENAPNTIYKEKPLHFNVKFGVRLLLD